jgi:hypothetical protein
MANPERERIPIRPRPVYDELVSRTGAVCREHLNEEYAQLCRRSAAALCRKRPSPATRGRVGSWACGIAYAIGSVNFLRQEPDSACNDGRAVWILWGEPATGAARAAEIRRIFKMHQMDPEWCLPSKLDDNPLAWSITVNGFPMDGRYAPREVQEEGLRLGLIPYLPRPRGQQQH